MALARGNSMGSTGLTRVMRFADMLCLRLVLPRTLEERERVRIWYRRSTEPRGKWREGRGGGATTNLHSLCTDHLNELLEAWWVEIVRE